MASVSSDWLSGLELHPVTRQSLRDFDRRRWWLLFCRGGLVGGVVLIAAALVVALIDYLFLVSDPIRWALSLVAHAVALFSAWRCGWNGLRDRRVETLAERLQSTSPRLRDDVLAAVQLGQARHRNGSESFRGSLQRRVGQRLSTMPLAELLPLSLLSRWLWIAGVVATLMIGLLLFPSMQFARRMARAGLPGLTIERASLTRVRIQEPSPPTRFVAAGNSVGVLAELSGRSAEEVALEFRDVLHDSSGIKSAWFPPRGSVKRTTMAQRGVATDVRPLQTASAPAASPGQGTFAANVSVGSVPVEYRVLAGDAITSWHRLTPLPRPSISGFEKRYRFPEYSGLPPKVETSEDGDLRAWVDTVVALTATFDQPVRQVTLRYAGNATADMRPVDETERRFVVDVPVKTPSTYQVTAVSLQSGIKNEFSRQHSIVPIPDQPPVAAWSTEIPEVQLVSPKAVLGFSGIVADDMPVDQVFQEFQVNDGGWQRHDVDTGEPRTKASLAWEWDLVRAETGQTYDAEYQSGDRILTRLVVIDRKGQRGESETIQCLVTETGLSRDRHQRFTRQAEWTEKALVWLREADQIRERLVQALDAGDDAGQDDLQSDLQIFLDASKPWAQSYADLHGSLRAFARDASDVPESSLIERTGVGLISVDAVLHRRPARLSAELNDLGALRPDAPEAAGPTKFGKLESLRSQEESLASDLKKAGRSLEALESLIRLTLDHRLAEHRLDDMIRLADNLQRLRDEPGLSQLRWKRSLMILSAQLAELDRLTDDAGLFLPKETRGWRDQQQAFVNHWLTRFDKAMESNDLPASGPQIVGEFADQLIHQLRHRIIDRRTIDLLAKNERDVASFNRLTEREFVSTVDDTSADGLTDGDLVERREIWHRDQPAFDTQYAADLNLLGRAVHSVVAGDWENRSIDGSDERQRLEKPSDVNRVLRRIADTFELLQSRADVYQAVEMMKSTASAESESESAAVLRLDHPLTVVRYGEAIRQIDKSLASRPEIKRVGAFAEAAKTIAQTRDSESFEQVRQRITARLYRDEPHVSAAEPIRENVRLAMTGLQELAPVFQAARDELRRFVLSLGELAEAARRETETAQRMATEPPPEADPDEPDSTWDEARRLSRETIEGLIDEANGADLMDRGQRESARDAEAMARLVRDALSKAEQGFEHSAQAFDDTADELIERLDQAARLAKTLARSNESDPIDSALRDAIRQAAEQLDGADQMEKRFDQAESLAAAANQDPRELLRRLEEELKTNPPMRESLGEIAEQAVREAEQILRGAAEQEKRIAEQLEQSDSTFETKKRQLAYRTRATAIAAQGIRESLLDFARTASADGRDRTSPELIRQAAERLDAAANRAALAEPQRPLSELHDQAESLNESLADVAKTLADAETVSRVAAREDIHQNADRRQKAESQAMQLARQSRDAVLKTADAERQFWSQRAREAGTQLQANARKQRDVSRELENLDREQQDDPSDEASARLRQATQQLDDLRRTEQAIRDAREQSQGRQDAVNERRQKIGDRPIRPLDAMNPASELAERLMADANQAIEGLREDLKSLEDETSESTDLRLPESAVAPALRQQAAVESAAADVTERLARAARHESRLDREQLAEQIASAVQKMSQVNQAADAVRSAADEPSTSEQAVRQVQSAGRAMSRQADQLAEMLRALDAADSEQVSASERPGGDATADEADARDQAKKLASTLDELDRALAAGSDQAGGTPPGGSPQPGDPSEAESASGSSPAESDAAKQPGQSSPGNRAVEASPTLAQAAQNQHQQSAQERHQSMTAGSPASPGSSETSGSPAAGADGSADQGEMPGEMPDGLGEFSRSSLMPDGESVDGSGIDRVGSQWGELRRQRSEETGSTGPTVIAPQYRRDVEAYFRAIARRAAQP